MMVALLFSGAQRNLGSCLLTRGARYKPHHQQAVGSSLEHNLDAQVYLPRPTDDIRDLARILDVG
jgi:hypothetical protein